jgi:CrcB protein
VSYLVVFLGAGLGGMLRHGVNVAAPRWGVALPYGTLLINVSGSLLAGLVVGYLVSRGEAGTLWRLFLMTGILGGYTTFSAFSIDAVMLFERGDLGGAAVYALGSVVFSIVAAVLGLWLARMMA